MKTLVLKLTGEDEVFNESEVFNEFDSLVVNDFIKTWETLAVKYYAVYTLKGELVTILGADKTDLINSYKRSENRIVKELVEVDNA